MRLWGRATSVNVQKALWTLEELGLDYERIDVGGAFGGLDTPEYGALNPTRKIPTLQDGDLSIWESNAIVRYLARNYRNARLAGATPADVGRADMWMEWFQNNAFDHIITLFYQTVRLPASERDPALLAQASASLSTQFQLLDQHLADRDFVVGDQLSVGDITVGACLYRYYSMDIQRSDLPALAAYYDRLSRRAAYRKTVMTSYDSLRPTSS